MKTFFLSICSFGKSNIQLQTSTSVYRFKRQLKSGSLEVISIPAFFYPNMLHVKQSTEDSGKLERYQGTRVAQSVKCLTSAQVMI